MSAVERTQSHEDDKSKVSDETPDAGHTLDKNARRAEVDSDVGSIKQTTGVTRMEAIARALENKGGRKILLGLAVAIYACSWVMAMESSTTYLYSIWATSDFQQHSSGLASLQIATGIISSVCVPFLARFADVFGRAWIYLFSLLAYTLGFIIIACSPTLTAYIVGSVAVAIGSASITLLNGIISADLIPLQWRGLSMGILSSPYLATVWYTSDIAQALSTDKNWRWGYAMYAIIVPVIMGPALGVILWLERKATTAGIVEQVKAQGIENGIETDKLKAELADSTAPSMTWKQRSVQIFNELDGFGLLLLGFGWSLLLLPFALSVYADGGYKNRSLIAMFVVGALCLLGYCFWEYKYALYPTAPRRLFKNRTFITAIIIDWIYMVAGYMQLTYIYSYFVVVTNTNARVQVIYTNILTLGLCGMGVLIGFVHRYTHRYKLSQVIGLAVKIVGFGLFTSKTGVHSVAQLVIAMVLVGAGGACSVVGNQVSSQASVPHQDVALVISLLTLWTSIGASIGSAIASAVWNAQMPGALRRYIPASVNDTQIATYFGAVTEITALDFNDPVRQGAISAYDEVLYNLMAPALGLSFIALIAACFQTNYYLGEAQNAVTNTDTAGRPVEHGPHKIEAKTTWQKIYRCWDL